MTWQEHIERYMLRKNYSQSTIRTYIHMLQFYARFCHQYRLDPTRDAHPFIDHLSLSGYSVSYRHQAANAVKFYWEQMLHQDKKNIHIDRPRKEKKLPTVLSKSEVKQLLNTIQNLKHRTILSLIYACGLRISEAANLRIADIDKHRACMHLKQAKGNKDRIVPLSDPILRQLREYYLHYRPVLYLFEGTDQYSIRPTSTPIPYSIRSIQNIFQQAKKKANIHKPATVHTLRHSYATHLYEMGISLRSIQVILGHSSSKTTEIYTHVSNTHIAQTPSPYDFL